MHEYVRDVLQIVAIACMVLGCVTLHRRIRNIYSFVFLASTSMLLFVATIGVWALGWHNGQPFVDDWRHAIALVFAESLLDLQFALIVVSAIAFSLASRSIRGPNQSFKPTPLARLN